MEITIEIPVPTSINKLYINEYNYQFNPKTRKKERMPTGRRILSPEGRKVKARIQGEARVQFEQQKDKWDYDWTRTNYCYQDSVIIFAKRGSDDNNVYKLLNDSLEGILYENDSRVLVRTQKIMYSSKNPKMVVTLRPVDFIGIFDDEKSLDKFKESCISCSRYRNGSCSILKDSIAGTLREEISSHEKPVCSAFKQKK